MKKFAVAVLAVGILGSGSILAQDKGTSTIASEMQKRLASAERQVVSAAEAMPENKFEFAPSQGEFKGVRNFGQQIKHIASISYMVCSSISGERAPEGRAGEDGPASISSKAQVVSYLKDAMAFCNKAYATITPSNSLESVKSPFGNNNTTRLGLAALNNSHAMDHYGQIVVYLRMNGIVPPASRPQQ